MAKSTGEMIDLLEKELPEGYEVVFSISAEGAFVRCRPPMFLDGVLREFEEGDDLAEQLELALQFCKAHLEASRNGCQDPVTHPGPVRLYMPDPVEFVEMHKRRAAAVLELLASAGMAADALRMWLDEDACDCEDGHVCGRPDRQRDYARICAAIEEAAMVCRPEINLVEQSQ